MSIRNYILAEAEQVSQWKDYVRSDSELQSAVKILDRITKAGYKAYIVGGAVRDIVMGKSSNDIDIATNMPIEEIAELWKIYDIGKSKDFGIVVVKEGPHTFEVAQFRQDGKYTDGRRPEDVTITGSFEKDAERRDFTINAMGIDKDGNIIDYFDGTKDIKDKVLRTVGNPKERFGEDYLRMLRAARFSAKLGFNIDPETKAAATDLSTNVKKLAPERIKDEIWKAASGTGDKFAKFLTELDDMGILKLILPEVTNLKDFEHNMEHHPEGGVWDHVLAALRFNKVEDPLTNLAILLHDVGKGVTFDRKEDGVPIYYGHAEEGVKLVNDIADRLRMSTKEKETLLYAVGNHMRFHLLHKMKPSKIAKLVSDDNWDVLVAVARADEFSRGTKFMTDEDFEAIVNTAIEIKSKWGAKTVGNIMKVVDGQRVMELTGLKPGKEVGKVIKKVTELVIDNNVTDPEMIDQLILRYHRGEIEESTRILSEGFLMDIANFIRTGWEKLKSVINNVFNAVTDLLPGEEVEVTIPIPAEYPKVQEDRAGQLKGDYHEWLVCKYVIEAKSKAVKLNKRKYGDLMNIVMQQAKRFEKELVDFEKSSAGKKSTVREELEAGSSRTAAYIINQAMEKNATIVGIWNDNQAAHNDNTKKGDIKVALEKNGKEIYKSFSLKLYYNKYSINLHNTSPSKILLDLFGPEARAEFQSIRDSDKKMVDLLAQAREVDKRMDKRKDMLRKEKGMTAKEAEDEETVAKWRQERYLLRNPLNPYLAEIFYRVLSKWYKRDFERFATGLLKLIGFSDKETDVILAVTKKAKKGDPMTASIIAEHPELNLNDVTIDYSGGIEVRIIHETPKLGKKIIMRFETKEGEQQTIATRVEYDPTKEEPPDILSKLAKFFWGK